MSAPISMTITPTCVADTYAFRVDESSPTGHLVGVLTLSGTEPVNHAIVSGNEHGRFAVEPETGKVSVAAPLDRNTIPSYVLLVEGTTSSGESLTATVSILLTSKLDLCSLGLAVPDPERNPGLVMDCAVLIAIGDRLLEENLHYSYRGDPYLADYRPGGSFLNWRPDTPITEWRGVGVGGQPHRVRTLDLDEAPVNIFAPPPGRPYPSRNQQAHGVVGVGPGRRVFRPDPPGVGRNA